MHSSKNYPLHVENYYNTGHCGPMGYSICFALCCSCSYLLQLVLFNNPSFLHHKNMPSDVPSVLVAKPIHFFRVDQIKPIILANGYNVLVMVRKSPRGC
jgi:hypothetical protein